MTSPLAQWAAGQRMFPDWVEACAKASAGMPAPAIFKRWAAITAVSAVLGRHVHFNTSKKGLGGIMIRPNLYTILVSRPGRYKSLSTILPFVDVLGRMSEPLGMGNQDSELNKANWQRYMPHNTHPIYTISGRVTFEAMTKLMGIMSHPMLEFPIGTFESAVTLVTDEFGSFMRRDDQALQTFLTEAWDSKNRIEYVTKNKGIDFVMGGTLTWMCGATPEQFIANLPKNANEQGLLSRLLPIYYEGARAKTKREIEGCDEETAEWLRKDLGRIASIYGQYQLSAEADALVDDWLDKGEQPLPTDPSMEEFNTRRWSHRMKVAMCLAASRRSGLVIEARDWEDAHKMVCEVEDKMPRLLRRFAMGEAGRFADQLMEYIESDNTPTISGRKTIRASRLKQEALRLCKTSTDVDRTIQLLVDSGYIEQVDNTFRQKEMTDEDE